MNTCSHCQNKKAPYTCGVCLDAICKSCVQFLPDDALIYAPPETKKSLHPCYCSACFTTSYLPELDKYDSTFKKAQEILVFDKSQGKETRFIRRLEKALTVENGLDQQDVTLKLAYLAASMNYNSIVDVDIKAIKVRDGAYQTTTYTGKGIPTNVNDQKLLKDRSLWSDPN